jgi:outer membrane lipoprotein LolB
MKLIKTSLLLTTSVLILTGCTHIAPKSNQYIAWQQRQTDLQNYNKWNIAGKLSVTRNNNKRDIASFTWQQDQQAYALKISAPLNLHTVTITGNKNQAEFCQSGKKCIKNHSIDKLFFDLLGWSLPFSNLHCWIKSLPAPTKTSGNQFDVYGHLIAFKQYGWLVQYADFKKTTLYDLPSVIKLQNQDFSIKIKINSRD